MTEGYQHCRPPCRAIYLVTADSCPNCGAANEALPVPELHAHSHALFDAVLNAPRSMRGLPKTVAGRVQFYVWLVDGFPEREEQLDGSR